jgi:hypothetical protein
MKRLLTINVMVLMLLNTSCINHSGKNHTINQCLLDFRYDKHNAVGPEGLASIVQINDKDFREILLFNSNRLTFKYYGGIYNIDSLYFPPPIIDIYDKKDSTIVFGQGVFRLRQYPELFMDSVIQQTKKEISIEVTDTLTNKKWTIAKCK